MTYVSDLRPTKYKKSLADQFTDGEAIRRERSVKNRMTSSPIGPLSLQFLFE